MKKVVIALVVVFLGFWLVTDPRGLADSAGSAGGWLADGGEQIATALIRFFRELG